MANFQKELETAVAAKLVQSGLSLFKGIVRQMEIDTRPEFGEVIYGEAITPFVSVASIIPERVKPGVSFSTLSNIERTVTVALIASKASVEPDAEPYREYRQDAMARLNMGRVLGHFASDPNSCVLKNYCRPRAPHEVAAWHARGKWVSAFDVVIETREKTVG